MGRAPRGRGAPGSLFHWVTATEDGIRVTDLWDTREEFGRFAEEQIGPITAEVGFPAPPEITFYTCTTATPPSAPPDRIILRADATLARGHAPRVSYRSMDA